MGDEGLLDWYKNEGFMKTSKRDIDIYALHLLIRQNPEYLKKDVYEISRELKITQAKVKSYLNEVQIRYEHLTTEKVILYIFETILNGSFSIDEVKKEIRLQIKNNLALDYLKYKMNKMMIFNDCSFNNSIVKLSFESFEILLKELLSEIHDDLIKVKIQEFKKTIKNEAILNELVSAISSDIPSTALKVAKVIYNSKEIIKSKLIEMYNQFWK